MDNIWFRPIFNSRLLWDSQLELPKDRKILRTPATKPWFRRQTAGNGVGGRIGFKPPEIQTIAAAKKGLGSPV